MKQVKVWAYLCSAWRVFSSDYRTAPELTESLAMKGYLTAPWNQGKKPTAQPSRRQILTARRGFYSEEEKSCGE